MKNLAVIPARSGSKGLPGKNIKLLKDKPLIAYTIEAALKSNKYDRVVVSTDSTEYAEIAAKCGAVIPYLRNATLSSDTASSWDVVKDILQYYKKKDIVFETVSLLQPTSPFRNAKDIKEAYKLFEKKNATAIISVCETDHSPLWSNTLPDDYSLKNFISKEVLNLPRQELPTYYRLNGAMYIVDSDLILNNSNIYNENTYAFIMSKINSLDIDDISDFRFAEYLIENSKLGY